MYCRSRAREIPSPIRGPPGQTGGTARVGSSSADHTLRPGSGRCSGASSAASACDPACDREPGLERRLCLATLLADATYLNAA